MCKDSVRGKGGKPHGAGTPTYPSIPLTNPRPTTAINQRQGATTYLDVGVDDELGQAEDLAGQVEGVPESRLLALLLERECGVMRVCMGVCVRVGVWGEGKAHTHSLSLPASLPSPPSLL